MAETSPEAAGRYAPHWSLDAVGRAGQDRISASRVLLVGLGGLGCPAAQYLVSSGVGRITICDFDRVHESNLSRQLLYRPSDLQRHKADVALEHLQEQNPAVSIQALKQRVDAAFLARYRGEHDLIVDASDNYGTRLGINAFCLESSRPWVMGACVRMEAQVMLFEPGRDEAPCYRCVYGQAPETLEDCPGAGIFAPVAGLAGTLMAHLALARLAKIDTPPGLHLFDGGRARWKTLNVRRQTDCAACSSD